MQDLCFRCRKRIYFNESLFLYNPRLCRKLHFSESARGKEVWRGKKAYFFGFIKLLHLVLVTFMKQQKSFFFHVQRCFSFFFFASHEPFCYLCTLPGLIKKTLVSFRKSFLNSQSESFVNKTQMWSIKRIITRT